MKIQLGHKGAYTVVIRSYLTAYEHDSVMGYAQRGEGYCLGTKQALKYIKRSI